MLCFMCTDPRPVKKEVSHCFPNSFLASQSQNMGMNSGHEVSEAEQVWQRAMCCNVGPVNLDQGREGVGEKEREIQRTIFCSL